MNEPETIKRILRESKTIAVIGLSDKPERYSYRVSSYMKSQGYKVIPVNPNISRWQGEKSYPDLKSVPGPIEVVDIFRRSEFVPGIVDEAISARAKAVWMQVGVVNENAAEKAENAGLLVVMNRCMHVEHMKFMGES